MMHIASINDYRHRARVLMVNFIFSSLCNIKIVLKGNLNPGGNLNLKHPKWQFRVFCTETHGIFY